MTERKVDVDLIVTNAAAYRVRAGFGLKPGLLKAARKAAEQIDPADGEALCDALVQVFRDHQLDEPTGEGE